METQWLLRPYILRELQLHAAIHGPLGEPPPVYLVLDARGEAQLKAEIYDAGAEIEAFQLDAGWFYGLRVVRVPWEWEYHEGAKLWTQRNNQYVQWCPVDNPSDMTDEEFGAALSKAIAEFVYGQSEVRL